MAVSKHKVRVQITFTKHDLEKIEAEAAKRGLSVTKLVNYLLRDADIT